MVPKLDFRFRSAPNGSSPASRSPSAPSRAVTDAIYEFFNYVVLHHRQGLFRRLNIGAADVAKLYRFAVGP